MSIYIMKAIQSNVFSTTSGRPFTPGIKMHFGQSDHKWTTLNTVVNGGSKTFWALQLSTTSRGSRKRIRTMFSHHSWFLKHTYSVYRGLAAVREETKIALCVFFRRLQACSYVNCATFKMCTVGGATGTGLRTTGLLHYFAAAAVFISD